MGADLFFSICLFMGLGAVGLISLTMLAIALGKIKV